MGTTMAFALLSSRPEYNNKIMAAFALAPVAFMSHVKSPIRFLAPFSKDIEVIVISFQMYAHNFISTQTRIDHSVAIEIEQSKFKYRNPFKIFDQPSYTELG